MNYSSIISKALSLIAFIIFFAFTSTAQDTTATITGPVAPVTAPKIYRHAISTNGIGVLGVMVAPVHRNDLNYEYAIDEFFTVSANIEGGVYSHGETTLNGKVTDTYQLGGWGLSVEGRIYPAEKRKLAPRGLFTGVYYKHYFLNEKYVEESITTVNEKHQAWGVGFDVGYKIGKKNFMFEPLLGYAVNWNNGVGSNPNLDSFYAGDDAMWTLFLRIEARLGVVF